MSRKSKHGRKRAASDARTESAAQGPQDDGFWEAPWSAHPKRMPEARRSETYPTINVSGGGQTVGLTVELHEVMTLPDSWAEHVGRVVRLISAAVADLNVVPEEEVARLFALKILNALMRQDDA